MGFPNLTAHDLEAYANETAAGLGLSIPQAYLPSVLDNLATLRSHAAILAAALADSQTTRPDVS